MISFTIRLLLKNKVLWVWPLFITAFVMVTFIWGDIQPAESSYSFLVQLGDLTMPSGLMFAQLLSMITLISIIGLPTHFAKNLEPERGSIILAKPVSRTDLLFADFAGMLAVSLLYTLFTSAALAVLTLAKGGIFPVGFFVTLLFYIPFFLLAYYITIVLLLILTNSYLAGAIIGYFVTGFSALFFNADQLLQMFGLTSDFAHNLMDSLSYLIPSAEGVQQLMQSILSGGLRAFDGGLFAFIIASFLPFFLLSFYLMRRKQF